MVVEILQTKLQRPPPRPVLVPRPRLTRQLDAGRQGRLTLVSAPAGFGKTTLVSEWLEGETCGWLSLDEGDNDPVRFLTYLIKALQTLDPAIGQAALAMTRAPQTPPPEVYLTSLINDIAGVDRPVLLVLDDYHLINTLAVHRLIAFILEHQPPLLHLVIATREDPTLPVARLRARGQLNEIRQRDLRFSQDECAEFLSRVMGLALSAAEVASLERRTEGWIAGLQLAAISMRGRSDLKGFVQAFSGSSRYILDYLIEEVFEQQAPEVQDFLLKTSVLERLSGPLCAAVAGADASQELLGALERANLFLVALDQSRTWFRYHRLFAELLRSRLRSLDPEAEGSLHDRASRWYEAHGHIGDAIQHALAGSDWGRAAGLIGQAADDMLKQGEQVTLIAWCQKLPPALVRENPDFGLSYTWALLLRGYYDDADELLAFFESIAEPYPRLMGQVATAQAYAARFRGDHRRVIEKSELALELLPPDDITSRSTVALNLGLEYWHAGQLRQAVPVLNEARELGDQVGNDYGSLTAQIFLARTLISQGILRQSEEQLLETVRIGGEVPILVLAHYDLSGIYAEWNQLDEAWEHLQTGLERCRRSGNKEFRNGGHLLQACLLLAQGNMLGALAEVEASHALARDFDPAVRARTCSCHAQIALRMGDIETAAHWVAQMQADTDHHSFYRFIGISRARLLLAQGYRAEAARLLEDMLARASQSGWGYAGIAIRALQVLAAPEADQAQRMLEDTLALSEPEGFIRTYVDAGPGLVPFLQEAARKGVLPVYVGQILNAYEAVHRRATTLPLVEPLSERELEVLNLVTAGLSNREIAQKLYLSPGTIKTHVHNICGKLGVRNRTEAASRAMELEIL